MPENSTPPAPQHNPLPLKERMKIARTHMPGRCIAIYACARERKRDAWAVCRRLLRKQLQVDAFSHGFVARVVGV